MEMFNPLDYGFSVRIVGSIDNRNILDATLFPTTIHMGCDDVWFGAYAIRCWVCGLCALLRALLTSPSLLVRASSARMHALCNVL